MTSRLDCLHRLGNRQEPWFSYLQSGGRKEEGRFLFIFVCLLSEWAPPLLSVSEVSHVGDRSDRAGTEVTEQVVSLTGDRRKAELASSCFIFIFPTLECLKMERVGPTGSQSNWSPE